VSIRLGPRNKSIEISKLLNSYFSHVPWQNGVGGWVIIPEILCHLPSDCHRERIYKTKHTSLWGVGMGSGNGEWE